jgi:hypothetical protein
MLSKSFIFPDLFSEQEIRIRKAMKKVRSFGIVKSVFSNLSR